MAHYSLIFRRDGIGPDKRIEFHGEDPGIALQIAHREASDRAAELWKDGGKALHHPPRRRGPRLLDDRAAR